MSDVNNPMVVAIDYDMTISRAPNEWARILMMMQTMNWDLYIVTGRLKTYNPEELYWLKDVVKEVHFTECASKMRYMREQGIEVDIWIDDCPESITYDYDQRSHTIDNPCYKVDYTRPRYPL